MFNARTSRTIISCQYVIIISAILANIVFISHTMAQWASYDCDNCNSNRTSVKGTWNGTYEIWEFDGGWDLVRTGDITMVLDQDARESLVTGHVIVENFWNFIEDSWKDNDGYVGGLGDSSKGYISYEAVTYNDDNTIKRISIPAKFHPDLTDSEDTTDDESYWWIFYPVLENNTLAAPYTDTPNSYIWTPIITGYAMLGDPIYKSYNISITMVKQMTDSETIEVINKSRPSSNDSYYSYGWYTGWNTQGYQYWDLTNYQQQLWNNQLLSNWNQPTLQQWPTLSQPWQQQSWINPFNLQSYTPPTSQLQPWFRQQYQQWDFTGYLQQREGLWNWPMNNRNSFIIKSIK